MTETESQKREAIVGVPITPDKNFVFFQLPGEDFRKKKKERLKAEDPWWTFFPGAMGGICEAIKSDESLIAEPKKKSFTALARAMQHEQGLFLAGEGQVIMPNGNLGEVQQMRDGELVLFMTTYWTMVINEIYAQKNKASIFVPRVKIGRFLKENAYRIRPTTVAAVKDILDRGF